GFACGLVASCSCAGRIFFPFAGAVVCVSFVCVSVCCGSVVVWPNAMSGSPTIAVSTRIFMLFSFQYDSYLAKILDPSAGDKITAKHAPQRHIAGENRITAFLIFLLT